VPGKQALLGRGVSSCATCDGFFFPDQDIAVVGGGDSAMEEATFLARFARSVTIIHRRDEFRASRIMLERTRNDPKMRWRTNAEVVEVLGKGNLSQLRLVDTTTGAESTLDVTGMFAAIGHDPRSKLVRDVLDTDEAGYVTVDSASTKTSIPGVLACGDLVDRTYRQAITAAGTGCMAALGTERFLAAAEGRAAAAPNPSGVLPADRVIIGPGPDCAGSGSARAPEMPVVMGPGPQ
jgi:thioredoxin reductase (NADPH)